MAVSSVGSSSSVSTQQEVRGDDDTASAGNLPPNDLPPAPAGNEANDPPSTQTGTPASPSTLSQIQPAATTPELSAAESRQLLDRQDSTVPNDAANADSMAALQGEALRGAPPDAISFEQQATVANQQIEALPADKRDFYRGALAAGSTYYNAATTDDQRTKLAQSVQSEVFDPVSKAYQQTMSDPNARVQQVFGKPYGSVYLGAAGQQQSDLLAEKGRQFNQATTPEERARIFGQAVDIRHTMQTQIGTMIDQEHKNVHDQWKQADQEIDQAMRDASSLQISSLGSLDDTRSFQRLQYFLSHGLNSERNAQQFQYRLEHKPDDFKLLHQWSDEAATKAQWATDHIQSDPFRRSADLPPLPPDPTHTTTENLRMGNFGADLRYRYQTENSRINEASKMYHAASQRGPLRYEYLDAHTPPLPLWQQQLQDGLGRFFVGLVPGVNLLVDYIVPAKSLPEEARQGIDFFSGVTGGMLGEARLPRFGRAGNEHVPASWSRTEEAGATNEVKSGNEIKPGGIEPTEPVTMPKGGTAIPLASTAAGEPGIPLVASEYAREPSGKLVPDANYRGLYRDETGQNFIQQGGQRYPVDWNDAARSWRMKPRDGAPNSPNMRLNEKGNWEVNLDTGLVGGVNPNAPNAPRFAFELYEQGYSIKRVAQEFGITPNATRQLLTRYAVESGELRAVQIDPDAEMPLPAVRASLYGRLTRGEPLSVVAHDLTGGDELAAYRGARNYARLEHLSPDGLPQERPWRIEPRVPPAAMGSPTSYPVTYQQYADIIEGDHQMKPTWQISQETGVPRAWIEQIRSRDGYWSTQGQEWVDLDRPPQPFTASPERPLTPVTAGPADPAQPGPSGMQQQQLKRPNPDPASPYAQQPGTSEATQQPPIKQARLDPGAPGTSGTSGTSGTAQPQVPAPPWGSGQLKKFIEDHTALSGSEADAIDSWLEGHTPASPSLQAELTARGFQDITPEMVHTYLTGRGPELTSTEMERIAAFLRV